MTKEQIIHRINEINNAIENLSSDKKELCSILETNFCPHKIFQKAKFIRTKTKRTGSIFAPKYVEIGRREEILVCVNIRVCDWDYSDFRYEFRRLKSDGTLTQNLVHVSRNEIEWLDEYYNPKK